MATENIKKNKDLRLAITITMIGDRKVEFKLIHICDKIYKFRNQVFYIDKWGYKLVKNTFNFQYYKNEFIMPDYIYKGNNHVCYFNFYNEKDRYDCLKKLSETFLGFTKSPMFYDSVNGYNLFKNKIVYYDEFWFVY